MHLFRATKHATVFRYHPDLSGEVYVQLTGESATTYAVAQLGGKEVVTVQIPSEDLLEFMSHITSVPPFDPEHDAHDKQTSELMVAHVQKCATCSAGVTHCEEYWKLLLGRAKDREQRAIQ